MVWSETTRKRAGNFLVRWGPVLLWMGIIFVFSAQPTLPGHPNDTIDRLSKKSGHVVEYAMLALLLRRALAAPEKPTFLENPGIFADTYATTRLCHSEERSDEESHTVEVDPTPMTRFFALLRMTFWAKSRWSTRAGLWPWVMAVLYAASDEFHQWFVPGREARIVDVLIDSLGAFLALILADYFTGRR